MQSERWQHCVDLFEAARARPVAERAAFIAQSCNGDEALRSNVESMLEAHAEAGDFIESTALETAPEFFGHDPDALIGQHLGSYRVDAVLGLGGMGVVYLAYDERLGRKVALKLIPPSLAADAAQLERLNREARTASALNHPNIVTVHEIGEIEGTHYIANEFIEGITLRERMAQGPIPPNEALEIATQLASALCVAHEAGIVHRDIKPENIMLRRDGYVKVLDFGIAKFTPQSIGAALTGAGVNVTRPGMIMGTTRYMSPEQSRGKPVDAQSDIWSLGVVLYEMLAGAPPFRGETPTDVLASILTQPPERIEKRANAVPHALQRIVEKALRKDAADRYQRAEEMLNDLRAVKANLARVGDWPVTGSKLIALAAVVVSVAVALGIFQFRRPTARVVHDRSPAIKTATARSEKSIAVLPFANLSTEQENAFFAEGVHDEILTHLARISELKVISRTSVMQYKKAADRNLREIAKDLGVAHILEGSVQRAANRVRVHAQLIDARTDGHLWAQTYDRDLADVFTIQSEIAKTIADQLQAKLSAREQTELERPPTADVAAFDLYTRAKIVTETGFTVTGRTNLLKAAELLNQAIALDPQFFAAYCALAYAHDNAYFLGVDRTPARAALGEAAIEAAFRLRPDAGEAHLARAEHLYRCQLDYDGALAALAIAGRTLPNDSRVFELTGYILRRRGQHEAGLSNLERAAWLDPRNISLLTQISRSYLHLRRFAEQAAILDRVLSIDPSDPGNRTERAGVDVSWKADTRPLRETIDAIVAENPAAAGDVAAASLSCALLERDRAAAERALEALGENAFGEAVLYLSRKFGEGLVARMSGDEAKARAAFIAAHAEQEKIVQEQPDYGPALCVLGLIDAALGRKEEALSEGQRAIELLPIEKDSLNGTLMRENFAIICAWAGEKDLAFKELETLPRLPVSFQIDYGSLKLHPYWDALRTDPRFERIVALYAPNDTRRN